MRALCLLLLAASPVLAQEIGLSVGHTSTNEERLFSPTGIDAFVGLGRGTLSFRAGFSRGGATGTVDDESFCRGGPQPAPCPAEPGRHSVTVTTGTLEGVLRTSVGQRGRIDLSLGLGIALAYGSAVNATGTRRIEEDGGGIGPTVGLQASYALFDRLPLRFALGARFIALASMCATDAGGYFNCGRPTLGSVSGGLVLDLGRLASRRGP